MPAYCVNASERTLYLVITAWNCICPLRHRGALDKVVHELKRDHFTDQQILIHCVKRFHDALENGNW